MALTLALVMILSLGASISLASPALDTPIIEIFLDPNENAKPMARIWFPDASAVDDPNNTVEKQIFELASKGFGGVEVCYLADTTEYNNEEARIYGWGTPKFAELLKMVYNAANKVPGGFQVDVTITAHWPPMLNTLDPNDAAASKETSYSFTKITQAALESGVLDLALPAVKTADSKSQRFIFTDEFLSAAVARVTGGSGNNLQLDFSTLTPISDFVAPKETSAGVFAGSAAGVPDAATAAANGWNYTSIIAAHGPEPTLPLTLNNGKLDANLDRARMADWQYIYQADLSDLALTGLNNNAAIAVGDYVILTTYMRGTGQVMAGGRGKLMHNMTYVTNYFNDEGTKILIDFWEDYILDDVLVGMMRANDMYIFEDSIEASKTSQAAFWASDFFSRVNAGLAVGFDADYAYSDILPSLMSSTNVTWSNDGGLASRIKEDYNLILIDNWKSYRIKGISGWSKERLNSGFRHQPHRLPGLDVGGSSMLIDVPEGDNGAKGDGLRFMSSSVNIDKKPFMTMEAVTGRSENRMNMADLKTEIAHNYSHGVNRVILHGTSYSKAINGYGADWPGWMSFGTSYGNSYTYRQPFWEDIATEAGYMARNQAILQNGKAQIDFAVLVNKEASFSMGSGNSFQATLDAGYSYNRMSEATLDHPDCIVTGGILAANGPAYKALVLDRVTVLSLSAVQTVLGFAKAGLPIILQSSNPRAVYGSNAGDDALVQAVFAELKALPNVVEVASANAVVGALAQLGVKSHASYSASQLETTLYTDTVDGTNYYYMYNNARPTNSGMLANGQGATYKGESRAINNVKITLDGVGVPYILDAMSGAVTQIGEYTVNNNGTISFVLDKLYGGDSTIVAVTTNTAAFPQTCEYVVDVNKPAADYSIIRDGNGLSLRSNKAGTYAVTFSEGLSTSAVVNTSLSVLDLTNAKWNLVIDSWGPYPEFVNMSGRNTTPNVPAKIDQHGIQISDPSLSQKIKVDFGPQNLGNWRTLPATQGQLAALGVPMQNVAGVGIYSLTFDAPADWDENTGAYLDLTYGEDQIGWVEVNGSKLKADNASDRVDLAGLLVPGENTITIKLNTCLYPRAFREHHLYSGTIAAVSNGLLSAKLTPYTQVPISNTVDAYIRPVEPSAIVNNPASYIVSLANAKGLGVVELSFTFSDEVLDKDSLTVTPQSSFTSGIFSGLTFKYLGSGIWEGTVKYMYPNNIDVYTSLDICKISATAITTGPATITLADFSAQGDNGDGMGIMPSQIKVAAATVDVGGKPAKYSKYDLNKDGSIDETDLLYLIYFYQWNDRDAGWATDDLYGVCANDCDFQVNGKVDLADMIELTANYGAYDPYAW